MTLPDGFNTLNNFDSSDQMKVPVIKKVKTMDDKLTLQLYENDVVVITIVPIGVLVMMKDDLKSCMSELFEEPAKNCDKCLNYGCDCMYCMNQDYYEEATE